MKPVENWDLYTKTRSHGTRYVEFRAEGRSLEAVERWWSAFLDYETAAKVLAVKYGSKGYSQGALYWEKGELPTGFRYHPRERGWILPNKRTPEGKAFVKECVYEPHLCRFGDDKFGIFEVGTRIGWNIQCGQHATWTTAFKIGEVWMLSVPRPDSNPPLIPLDAIPMRPSEVAAMQEALIEAGQAES